MQVRVVAVVLPIPLHAARRRPHARAPELAAHLNGVWHARHAASLWTFFALVVGAHMPCIAVLPASTCGSKRFKLDALDDHVSTCTGHSGDKKVHDRADEQLAELEENHLSQCSK